MDVFGNDEPRIFGTKLFDKIFKHMFAYAPPSGVPQRAPPLPRAALEPPNTTPPLPDTEKEAKTRQRRAERAYRRYYVK